MRKLCRRKFLEKRHNIFPVHSKSQASLKEKNKKKIACSRGNFSCSFSRPESYNEDEEKEKGEIKKKEEEEEKKESHRIKGQPK